MELVDTHAHLNFASFNDDRKDVIQRALDNGVKTIVNVGTDVKASEQAIALAAQNDFIYATCGIHPTDSPDITIETEMESLKKLISQPKVVAVGECGLDFYREENQKERGRQIKL